MDVVAQKKFCCRSCWQIHPYQSHCQYCHHIQEEVTIKTKVKHEKRKQQPEETRDFAAIIAVHCGKGGGDMSVGWGIGGDTSVGR